MATPEGKRKAEAGPDGEESNGVDAAAKRPRLDGAPAAAAGGGAASAAAAKPKPAIDLSVLEKAKKALQLQKELKEKLRKLQVPTAAAPAAAAAAAPAAASLGVVPVAPPPAVLAAALAMAAQAPAPKVKPPPLVVDDQGRELDAAGQPVAPARAPAAAARAAPEGGAAGAPPQVAAGAAAGRFFDPGIGNRALQRMQRKPRAALEFVAEGRFQKQAEMSRLRAKFGMEDERQLQERKKAERALAAEKVDVNLIPLGQRVEVPAAVEEPLEPIPDVEWWDARLLLDKGASMQSIAEGGEIPLRHDRISNLVEHPVLVEPPTEAPPPPPQPLKLTKRELKKLRTQRRVAREKEKQELVRQGLLEPPKPKVKISNLMRVLGAEATADPTAIEAEVRRQMAERAAAHEDRNLARKLTPAERRDKKLKKLLDDTSLEAHVALYKVGDLSNPQLRFKVDVNARENHLTGSALLADDFSMVIVEGGPKTLNRYQKLMLRRINWNQGREEEEEAAEGGDPAKQAKPPNYCHLVWQGVVKERHFEKFSVETVRTEAAARKLLGDHGVGHYWDLCAAYAPE